MTCRMCPAPAWRWVSWWNPQYPELQRGQQGNVCLVHMHEVWAALDLLARERVVIGEPE